MKNVGTSAKVFLATKMKSAVVSTLISLAFVSKKGPGQKSFGLIEVPSGKPSGCLRPAEADPPSRTLTISVPVRMETALI